MDAQRREIDDPHTSAERLAQLSVERPDLQAQVVSHPNAYPGLVDWIAQHGAEAARPVAVAWLTSRRQGEAATEVIPDTEAQALSEAATSVIPSTPTALQPSVMGAATARDAHAPQQVGAPDAAPTAATAHAEAVPPHEEVAPTRSRRGLWIGLGVLGVLLVIAAVLLAIALPKVLGGLQQATDSAVVAEASPTEADSTLPTWEPSVQPSTDPSESAVEGAPSESFCEAYRTLAQVDTTSIEVGQDLSVYVQALRDMALTGPSEHQEIYDNMATLFEGVQNLDYTVYTDLPETLMSDFTSAIQSDAVGCVLDEQ